jgi:hypothetical protein
MKFWQAITWSETEQHVLFAAMAAVTTHLRLCFRQAFEHR